MVTRDGTFSLGNVICDNKFLTFSHEDGRLNVEDARRHLHVQVI